MVTTLPPTKPSFPPCRFIGEQGLEVWETHEWPGVLALMTRHVDEVSNRADGPSRRSADAPSDEREAYALPLYGGICPDGRPSDSIAIDVDSLDGVDGRRPSGSRAGQGFARICTFSIFRFFILDVGKIGVSYAAFR